MSHQNTPNKNTPTKKQKQNRKENVKQKTSNPSTGKMKKPMMAQPVKVVEKVMVESPRVALPPKQDESWLASMWNKAKDVGVKAWDWFKTGGWEQVLTIGASFLDDARTAHLAYALDDGTVVPAGTVIYAEYLTPSSFPNTALNDQARNFTYYEFLNSKIHVLGTGSADTASGAIGIFICPDPELEIQAATPTQIENLVRENGGKIVRLDRGQSIPFTPPMANSLLFVTGSDQFDLRRTTQGQLFVIAYTDIDFSDNNVAVSLEWKAAFGKGTSSIMQPVPVMNSIASLSTGAVSLVYNANSNTQVTQLGWTTMLEAGSPFIQDVSNSTNLILYPGTYKFSGELSFYYTNNSGTASVPVLAQLFLFDNNASTAPVFSPARFTNVVANATNSGAIGFDFVYSSTKSIVLYGNLTVFNMNVGAQTNITFNAGGQRPYFNIMPIVVYSGVVSNPLIAPVDATVQSYLYARHHKKSVRALKHSSKRIKEIDPDAASEKDKDNKKLSSMSDAQLAALVRERRLSLPPSDGGARS